MGTAMADDLVDANPCRIRGAGQTKRRVKIEPASVAELERIVAEVPPRYRLMVLLASWCALRFGELTELRRRDVQGDRLRVRRGVVHVGGQYAIGAPESDAGVRDVAIPPHLLPVVKGHLLKHTQPGADGLLFPGAGGGHMAPSSLYGVFYPAREKAGRPDLRFHDLRHTGAVLAAATGATLAELMGRLGHSTQPLRCAPSTPPRTAVGSSPTPSRAFTPPTRLHAASRDTPTAGPTRSGGRFPCAGAASGPCGGPPLQPGRDRPMPGR